MVIIKGKKCNNTTNKKKNTTNKKMNTTNKKKKNKITTFKTNKNNTKFESKRVTKKIQNGRGLGFFTSSKKTQLLKKYKEYLKIIEDYYFKNINDTISNKKFKQLYKHSHQKQILIKLNTKYRIILRKCIYKILIILYKNDKYHKSSYIVTNNNQHKQGEGYSLYRILNDNNNNIVTDFFTNTFNTNTNTNNNISIDNINDEIIKAYITNNKNHYSGQTKLYHFESTSALDRNFNHSNKKIIAISVKDNEIKIINNVFTQIKYYINYLTNNNHNQSLKKKDVIKIHNMLKTHFKYVCNNIHSIADFFIEYIKYKYL